MIHGQIITYRYNGLYNSKAGIDRNLFTLSEVNVHSAEQFREEIANHLDHIEGGKGYVLVKWSGRMFLCERDLNNPKTPYVRHEVTYHPLMAEFTI